MLNREDCLQRDRDDVLAHHRDAFIIPEGLIYLDGNSLGPLPRDTSERLQQTIHNEWGEQLVSSWNSAGWMQLAGATGNKIARLVGARDGEVVATDSTSVNLFKVLSAALQARPERRVILSERSNFPTDLYVAEGLIAQLGKGHLLKLVEREELLAAMDDTVAVVMLTQVDYRTGSRLDMQAFTAAAHAAGAVTVWDLAHSAGAFPVDLEGARADFAIGCGYKYLNGGPGATAFLYVARRHQESLTQPLIGWMGHARPFDFVPGYEPAPGITHYLSGTPAVLSLTAMTVGVDCMLAAQADGGMNALFDKASALIDLFIEQVEQRCSEHGLACVTPREPEQRGSQVSFSLARGEQAYAVMQALIERGVVGDFRAPDIMRFGFAPLYLRYVDAFDAAQQLADVLDSGAWNQPRFLTRQAVT